jgi:Lon protease-like protein
VELPLFPLNVVLFPDATLPLHIFEERYKQMIRRCLDEASHFGVLLIRSGVEAGGPALPYEIGTTARITEAQELEEGRLNIICQGERRFRLLRTLSESPYLTGEVELLRSTDRDGEHVDELAGTVTALFAECSRLYLAASNQWSRQIGVPGEPDRLADFVAARLQTENAARQRLLEELSVATRLKLEAGILSDAIRDMTRKVTASRARRWRTLGAMN